MKSKLEKEEVSDGGCDFGYEVADMLDADKKPDRESFIELTPYGIGSDAGI